MSTVRRTAAGTTLRLTSAKRAASMYPVRQLLEAICDRFRAGAEYGTIHYGLILNASTAYEIYARTGLERNVLEASCYIREDQAKALRVLGEQMDQLPFGQDLPASMLASVPIPLPRFVRGTGTLTMAESMFRFRSSRSHDGVSGFSAMALDVDVYAILSDLENNPENDVFGLRYVAAAAWANAINDDFLFRHEIFEQKQCEGETRYQRGLSRYTPHHPLAGTTLYEVRHLRRKLVLTPAARYLERVLREAPHNWELSEQVQAAVAEYILDLLHEAGVSPTCCTLSGRGVHLRWRFSEWIPAGAAARVKGLQLALHALLRPLGSDANCATDIARLYRVPGLYSDRVGRKATRYRHQQRHGLSHLLGIPRTLDDWASKIFADDRAVVRHGKGAEPEEKPKRVVASSEALRAKRRKNLMDTGERRIQALYDLAIMRGGIHHGERNKFLWCAASLIRSHVPFAKREAHFERFAGLLQQGLSSRELNRLRGGLDFQPGQRTLHLSNAFICDLLDIAEQEISALPALTPAQPKAGAWKRTARRALLVSMLASGAPTHLIAQVMGYRLQSLYVVTSRVYQDGTLTRSQVSRARLAWGRKQRVPNRPQARRQVIARAVERAASDVPLQRWLEERFELPGGPPLQPDAPLLREIVQRAAEGLALCVRQAA